MSNETSNEMQPDEHPLDDSQAGDAAAEATASEQAAEEDVIQFDKVDESATEEKEPDGFSRLDQLEMQLAASEKRALVAVADLENYRKRANKQTRDQVKYASIGMMGELLESVDNLNRAVEAAEKEDANSSVMQGVKMVSDQILNILQSNKCEQIDSVGQPFDPNQHEAVMMQPSDEFEANTVMMEIRTGYKLHDRIIRPAQVFVSTGPATES